MKYQLPDDLERHYYICTKCGAICDIGLMCDRFMCSKCGNTEYCDAEQQKALMGDAYGGRRERIFRCAKTS